MEIQSYVVEPLFQRYFTVLQPIKCILNLSEIIRKVLPVCDVEILQVTVKKN